MSIIMSVHGFNVRDKGAATVDTFSPLLTACGHDFRPNYADYGFTWLLSTRFGGIKRTGQRLAHRINRDFPSDARIVLLCHSNGLAVAHECIKHTSRVDTIVSFNGALNRDASFSHTVDRIINFYDPGDNVLKWGAWLRPFHSWGRAGQAGLTDDDERIENIAAPDLKGKHSNVWQTKALRDKYSKLLCAML